jgi:hypothetical protein
MNLSPDMRRYALKDAGVTLPVYESPYFEEHCRSLSDMCDFKEVLGRAEREVLQHGGEKEFLNYRDSVSGRMIESVLSHPSYAEWKTMEAGIKPRRKIRKETAFTREHAGRTYWRIDLVKADYHSIAVPFPEIFQYSSCYQAWACMFTLSKYITESKRIRSVVFGKIDSKRQCTMERDVIESILDIHVNDGNKEEDILHVMHDEALLACPPPENIREMALEAGIKHPFRVERVDVGFLETVDGGFAYLNVDGRIEPYAVPACLLPQVWKAIHKRQIYQWDLFFMHDRRLAKYATDIFGNEPPWEPEVIYEEFGASEEPYVPFMDRLSPERREKLASDLKELGRKHKERKNGRN